MPVFNLRKLILALVIAVVVGIVCVALLGPIIGSLAVPIAAVIGGFLVTWGWVRGVLAGLWYYFAG